MSPIDTHGRDKSGPYVYGVLTVQGQRVDFLYRNIDFVSSTLDECNAGIIRSDYWQQPAYGFHNFMYCTETRICRSLYDPDAIIASLKAKVTSYAPILKQAICKNFLWSARFTLDNAYKPIIGQEQERVAYEYCRQVTRQASKTFYWGSAFLPPAKRRVVWAIYALSYSFE